MTSSLDRATAVADTVLYGGDLRLPFEPTPVGASAPWQYGLLLPPQAADDAAGQVSSNRTECLLLAGPHAVLHVRVRFLLIRARVVERLGPGGAFTPVPSLRTGDGEVSSWAEAVEREVDAVLPLPTLIDRERRTPFTEPGRRTVQEVQDGDGRTFGRIVREHRDVTGLFRLRADRLAGQERGHRLVLAVENRTEPGGPCGGEEAMRHALIATHALIGVSGGEFVSLLDPPTWATAAARDCHNVHSWPVLVGEPGEHGVLLASPVVLPDYPMVRPVEATGHRASRPRYPAEAGVQSAAPSESGWSPTADPTGAAR